MRYALILLAMLTSTAHAAGHVVATAKTPTGLDLYLSDLVGYCPVGADMYTYQMNNDAGDPVQVGCWRKTSEGIRLYQAYPERNLTLAPAGIFRWRSKR